MALMDKVNSLKMLIEKHLEQRERPHRKTVYATHWPEMPEQPAHDTFILAPWSGKDIVHLSVVYGEQPASPPVYSTRPATLLAAFQILRAWEQTNPRDLQGELPELENEAEQLFMESEFAELLAASIPYDFATAIHEQGKRWRAGETALREEEKDVYGNGTVD